jgi:hypothetical protein
MQGGATGTGTVTLLAAVTNTNQTLTLPDVTDTVAGIAATQTLTNKTLTSPTLTTPNIDSAQFATVTGTAPIYPCRAWVNFNGTGTVAIRASGNVSSITDNGTGAYTVNFTTAMPNANYAITCTSGYQTGVDVRVIFNINSAGSISTTSFPVAATRTDNVAVDPDICCVSVFR